jgi:DNA-binding phage protein
MPGVLKPRRKVTTKSKVLLDLSSVVSASRRKYSDVMLENGMAVNNLSHWFNDVYDPRLKQLEKVAESLGYEVRLVPRRDTERKVK